MAGASGSRAAGQLFSRRPDPRIWQAGFVLLLFLALLFLAVDHAFDAGRTYFGTTVLLAVLVSGATVLVPWERLPGQWMLLLPLADIAVGGVAFLDARGAPVAFTLVVPALWCAVLAGRRGAAACVLATAVFLGIPAAAPAVTGASNLALAFLLPCAAAAVCFPFALLLEAVEAERAEVLQHQRIADAILDTVDVGLVLLDEQGNYVLMNKRHDDFMRLAFPEGHDGHAGALGSVFAANGTTLLSREEMPSFRASHGEEFDDARIWVGEDPLTSRALSVSARTFHDANGRQAGAALAYKDVTDFMAALKVKDEFVASVSHELRTPLTSIMGYVDLVRDRDDLPPGTDKHLEVVARNADRLGRLVADLLHAAQMTSGPMDVVRAECDLALVVAQSVAAAQPAAAAAGLTLETDLPASLVAVVDGQRMGQAVDNLISNAIKYTPAGGEICVRLATDLDGIELSVTDSGVGIDAADRGRLFTRFFRSREAAEQSIQGVGLGLSITKSIVESHGGRIEVESEPGRGSVFRVRLPLGD